MATISFRAEMSNLRAELAKVPGVTEAEAKRMVAALNKQLKEAEQASKRAFKEAQKGPDGFVKSLRQAEYVTAKVNNAWMGIQKAGKLAAAGVAAVSGAIAALTKGAISEAERQVAGLTDATDDQRQASIQLLAEQAAVRDELSRLRTDVLGPLIPVVADTAAGFVALGEQLRATGEAADLGDKLASAYREDLIPALTAFGMTADYVYTGIKAAITQAIDLNKTLFYSLTFQWSKAVDAAANVQDAWADLGDVKEKWGEWQDVILETNAELDELPPKIEKVTDTSAQLGQIAHAAYLKLLEPIERVIALRDDELEQIDDLAKHAKDLSIAEEARAAVTMAADMEIARMREELALEEQERLDEEKERLSEEAEAAMEAWQQYQRERAKIAEAAEARIQRAQMDTLQAAESLAGSMTEIAYLVAGQKIEAAQDGTEEEKKAALEAFEIYKALGIVQATISTAMAVVSAMANTPGPFPVALAMAIAAGVAGAVQIALIASQSPPSFHTGGSAHDEMFAVLRKRESVLSPTGTAAAGGEEGVRALNRGEPGAGGGGSVTVSAIVIGHRVMDYAIQRELTGGTGSLARVVSQVRPLRRRAYGRHVPGRS